MFLFGSLSLVFSPFGVCDLGRDELLFEVFLVVVIPLKEVLFIVRGDRREENVMYVFGENDYIVVWCVCVISYYLEPEFRMVCCDAKAADSMNARS